MQWEASVKCSGAQVGQGFLWAGAVLKESFLGKEGFGFQRWESTPHGHQMGQEVFLAVSEGRIP